MTTLAGNLGDTLVTVADFTHLPTRCKFVAFMPQWEFLDFLAEEARRFPAFDLRMRDARRGSAVGGRPGRRRARADAGRAVEIRADLTIAADGRESIVREARGTRRRRARRADGRTLAAPDQTRRRSARDFGYIRDGRIMALIDRGAYWQCAYVIPKGTLDELQGRGLEEFRARDERDRAVLPTAVARSRAGTTSSC